MPRSIMSLRAIGICTVLALVLVLASGCEVLSKQSTTSFGYKVLQAKNGLSPRIAFSPDGNWLVSADSSTVRLWDLHHPDSTQRVLNSPSQITAVAFSADNNTVAVGSSDGKIHLWDLTKPSNNTSELNVNSQGEAIEAVAFSADGRWLAASIDTAKWNSAVRLWDVRKITGAPILLQGSESLFKTITFSPDSKQLAAADTGGLVYLWDVAKSSETDNTPEYLQSSRIGIESIRFSPTGDLLATSNEDSTLTLWDLRHEPKAPKVTLDPFASVPGKNPKVINTERTNNTVAFSPDGEWLAAGYNDGTIRLWRTAQLNGTPIILSGLPFGAKDVEFSPDSRTLAAIPGGDNIWLWDIGSADTTPPPR